MTITGLRMWEFLKKRVRLFEETEGFVEMLKIELRYSADELMSILKKASFLSSCKGLDYLSLCCKKLESGEDFPSAWKNALRESRKPFTAYERNKLSSLGEILGTTDIDSQIVMLNLYSQYIKAFLKKAEKAEKSYGRLSVAASFLMGFTVFILVV